MKTGVAAVVDHAAQTLYSDPGAWAVLFDEIEPNVDAASCVARNVVAHYRAHAGQLPESSRDDISLRWLDAILDTDQRRNDRPLSVVRAVGNRVQGCCRNHTLLAVALLRHHGIPARSRVGFATYLSRTWNYDHVIVEAWLDGRWRRFDTEFDAPLPDLSDPTDIPHGSDSPFLTGAQVWLAHRAGSIDVSRFGVAEGLGIGGDWFVFDYVIEQVAHRFGDELLLWDNWGAMTNDLRDATSEDLALVDDVARALVQADEGDLRAEIELLRRYEQDERLHPRRQIRSVSPNGGLFSIDLTTRTTTQTE